MAFFYGGLGIAMMTGIVGIFQIAVSLKTQQHLYKPIQAIATSQKEKDKRFLQLLNDLSQLTISLEDTDQNICQYIRSGILNSEHPFNPLLSNYIDLSEYNSGGVINSSHSKLENGCMVGGAYINSE